MNKIVKTFINLAKPYENNKKNNNFKLEYIQSFFSSKNIPFEYIPGQGLIVNKQEKPRLVCVSHIDLINLFNLEFCTKNNEEDIAFNDLIDSMCLEESSISVEGICVIHNGFISGALDNTITNAVALLVCEELISNGINDIEFFFSEMEEIGLKGMKNYLNSNLKKSKNTFFVNLDVTNEGFHTHISVEFDKTRMRVLKHLVAKLNKEHVYFTGQRFCDDIDAVIASNCNGLSFCLPTNGNIHSYKNKAKLSSLVPYKEGLYEILSTLKFNKNDPYIKI